MKNRKIEEKITKQVVIDAGLHKLVKTEAARSKRTIKSLVEESLIEVMQFDVSKGGDENEN